MSKSLRLALLLALHPVQWERGRILCLRRRQVELFLSLFRGLPSGPGLEGAVSERSHLDLASGLVHNV